VSTVAEVPGSRSSAPPSGSADPAEEKATPKRHLARGGGGARRTPSEAGWHETLMVTVSVPLAPPLSVTVKRGDIVAGDGVGVTGVGAEVEVGRSIAECPVVRRDRAVGVGGASRGEGDGQRRGAVLGSGVRPMACGGRLLAEVVGDLLGDQSRSEPELSVTVSLAV
jgi:hypothetical protein